MAKRQQQSAVRRFFRSRLFLITAGLLALLVATSYVRGYYQEYKIKQEIDDLKSEVSRLEKKKIESLEILDYVMSSDFVEEKARTELNMKKPGERVLIISDHETAETQDGNAGESVERTASDLNNPQKWWYYFKTRGGANN